jgi:hypothetical protein
MSRWMYSGHTWEVRYSRELRKQNYIVSNGRQERKKEAARRERGVMYTLQWCVAPEGTAAAGAQALGSPSQSPATAAAGG